MSHDLLVDSVDTSLASLLYIVVQQMRCSAKCTISERDMCSRRVVSLR